MLRSLPFNGIQIRPQLVPRDSGDALHVENALGGDARPLLDGLHSDAELASEFGLVSGCGCSLINDGGLSHGKDNAGFSCVLQVIPAMRASRIQARLVSLESIHKRIRRLREAKKKTQQQLAVEAGVTYQSVQEWEREGGTAPSRKRLPRVAAALGVTAPELLYGDGSTPHRIEQVKPRDPDLTSKEEILLEIFRGLFSLQQEQLIVGLRALFDANQITRKELGQKPLRGVSDAAIRNAYGDAPFHLLKRLKKAKRLPRDLGDAMGDFFDDLQ